MGASARSLLAGIAERASLPWVGELELGAELVEGVRASVCLVEGRTPRLVETYGGVYSHQPDRIVVKTSLTKAVRGDVERCGAVVDGVVGRLGELSPQRGYQTCLDVGAGRESGSELGDWEYPETLAWVELAYLYRSHQQETTISLYFDVCKDVEDRLIERFYTGNLLDPFGNVPPAYWGGSARAAATVAMRKMGVSE